MNQFLRSLIYVNELPDDPVQSHIRNSFFYWAFAFTNRIQNIECKNPGWMHDTYTFRIYLVSERYYVYEVGIIIES